MLAMLDRIGRVIYALALVVGVLLVVLGVAAALVQGPDEHPTWVFLIIVGVPVVAAGHVVRYILCTPGGAPSE